MSVAEKLDSKGPHKLLALDGGGIRGMITLAVLAELQSQLQAALKRDDTFVLADYFDYIGGTSTGAIIATCLSLGWRVERIQTFYEGSGQAMFDKASVLKRFKYKFEDEKLSALLQQEIGPDVTLGDERLRTLLLLVMRNATTDSPWPVSNNPRAKYNLADRVDCNLRLPLWQLVRASTAAPTYFPPETIMVGSQRFVFVDGGVTMFNNPAFQLFLMATMPEYKLNWARGEQQMLLVSIGTGAAANANADLAPEQMNLLYNAASIPSALMAAASVQQDFLCRIFGRACCGGHLDNELGTLLWDGVAPSDGSRHFTYMRYNADLSRKGLDALGLSHIAPADVQKMDSVEHIHELGEVGRAVARRDVKRDHFAGFLE